MPRNKPKRTVWNFSTSGDTTEVLVYDQIADKQSMDWWSGEKNSEVTPLLFRQELNQATTANICVRINSGGGDVFAAEAIRTAIQEARSQGKKITCKIDGICASAAVGIAAACESRAIASSGYFMIHDPMAFVYGYLNESELTEEVAMLQTIKQGIVNAYTKATGKNETEIAQMMQEGKWFTGKEAVEEGFCDELMFEEDSKEEGGPEVANMLEDLAIFGSIPSELMTRNQKLQNFKKKMVKEGENDVEIKNVADLVANYPDLVKQIQNQAREEGILAERGRMEAIDKIAFNVSDKLVNEAKYGEKVMNAGDLALKALESEGIQARNYTKQAQADFEDSGANEVQASHQQTKEDKEDMILDSIIIGANGGN